jgi:hypothetical protein
MSDPLLDSHTSYCATRIIFGMFRDVEIFPGLGGEEVRRSGGQEVRRSGGEEVRRSGGQEVRRSGG